MAFGNLGAAVVSRPEGIDTSRPAVRTGTTERNATLINRDPIRNRLATLGVVLMSRPASARREERADRESVSDEQRRRAGCIGGQMADLFLTGS